MLQVAQMAVALRAGMRGDGRGVLVELRSHASRDVERDGTLET